MKENPISDSIICTIHSFFSMADASKNKNVLITVLVIAVLATASYGVYRSSNSSVETVTAPQNQNEVAPIAQQDVPSVVSASYKDGEYNVVGNYISPGGAEEIGVKITLKDNVVTDVAVEPKATRPISKKMQETVSKNVTLMVIGKKIDEVTLDKVSGSSLTPKGFNDAVAKIKTQAQA